jgi:hypothetical protein
MSLLVEFRIDGETINMTEAAASLPDVTIRIEKWRTSGDMITWFLWANGDRLDHVVEEFAALPNVEQTSVINESTEELFFSISMYPHPDAPPDDLLREATVTHGYIEPDCLHLTARVSCRDVLKGSWQYLRNIGIDVSVERLYRASGDEEMSDLTDAQFEALAVAQEMGYYDEHTTVTQAEVAEELEIARSSLSDRLRRAESQLVQRTLELAD